jgi:hypothetical protein
MTTITTILSKSTDDLNLLSKQTELVLLNILKNLSYQDTLKFCGSSTQNKEICSKPNFWRTLAFEKYGIDGSTFDQKNYQYV